MSVAVPVSEVEDVARRAEAWTPQEILDWALHRFQDRIAFAIYKRDRIGNPSEIFFARRKALGRATAFLGQKFPVQLAHEILPFPSVTAVSMATVHQPLNGEDDPAERAILDKVAQSIRRLGQREGLSHDWLDCAGLKQWDDGVPCFLPSRRWLSKQREALHRGTFPD